jgi:hypothetical protein
MKKLILFVSFLLLICLSLFAQTPSGAIIRGKITDGGNQKILDAATVSLYREGDSSLIKTNLTDKEGNYEFENLLPGRYFVVATSIGHLSTSGPAISLAKGQALTIPPLTLTGEVRTLKGVTIAYKKPFIERKIDRTIINVDASITNAGTTALEVLEKSPGVSVDKDGNISLKGKQGVMVMMDGRPSYLSGQELANLLKNMPSSSIDQIEIMTNPSAKYDAAGNSGIINIKTKKNKMHGMNGSVSATVLQSKYTKTTNSLNLNYRTGKVNLFGNYSYTSWQTYQNQRIVRNFRNANTKLIETIFDQDNVTKNAWQEHSVKLGMDFYASKKTTLGVVFSGFANPSHKHGVNTNHLNNGSGHTDSIVVADNTEKGKSNNFSTNFNIRHSFDSSGKEFTVDLDYLNYNQNSSQYLVNNYYYPDYSEEKPASELMGNLPSKINIYSAKTDWTFPLKHTAKIETGLKASYVTTDNDALYQNNTPGGYVTDEGKTNHFIYKENINAAYVNFSREVKKWGFQAGLRAENTHATGHQIGNASHPDSAFTKDYINLFPTAYISYAANANNTFSLNYGRRIDRPDYEDLNPFYYFLDEYTYQVGNTLLQPQFSDNFELSHIYKGFLSTTLNFSETYHVFAPVLKQITSERKTFQTKENLASKTNLGLAVSANFPVTSIWNTDLYSNVNYNSYKGQLDGGELDIDATTFMANMNNQFRLKKGWSAELSGFYRSRGIESQIVINEMWRLDGGVQKQLLKNKASLKFSVRDIFNTQLFSGTVNYQDIDVYIRNYRDSRTFSLTFSYRFGKPLKNQRQRKTGGASDEQSRVKSSSN